MDGERIEMNAIRMHSDSDATPVGHESSGLKISPRGSGSGSSQHVISLDGDSVNQDERLGKHDDGLVIKMDQAPDSSPTNATDVPKPCGDDHGQIKTSKISAAMLLMTWSTSSSNVMYPWTYGVLGVVFGPMAMLFTFSISYFCTLWTIKAARATNSKTLGELGEKLYGKPGRVVMEGSQIMFQQLFLPVAIVLSADCLKSLLKDQDNWFDCNIHPTLLFLVIAVFLMQFAQQLGHATILAYISIGGIFVQTICLLYAFGNESPNSEQTALGDDTDWEFFVGQGDHPERYKWYEVLGAFGVFIYSCLPNCIVVETMATLEDPDDMVWAGTVSFIFYASVYLLTGIPAVLCWGGNIGIPVTTYMKNSPAGVIAKCILIYSTLLDFIIASTTVNRWVISILHLEHDYSRTMANAIRWAAVGIPSLALAITMALFVPKLESLTGLLNSVTGSTVQISSVALFILLSKSPEVNAMVTGTTKILMGISLVVGIYLTVTIFAETCYYVFEITDYSGDFWCEVVG